MSETVYTLGYEGLSLEVFIARLKTHHIHTVLDVRAVPISRKRGFSKSSFSLALREVGIGYTHLPVMGCPKPIRDRYKVSGDWAAYTKAFLTYLDSQQKAVDELAETVSKTTCCLVCFEADFNRCHRTFVGRAAIQVAGLHLAHLTERTITPDQAAALIAA